jgi:copper resistance protein C
MVRASKVTMKRLLGGAAALILCATVAWGHAILVASSPEANSIVSGPNIDISLKFNVRIDSARSVLRLVNDSRMERTLSLAPGKASNVVSATATDVTPGKYKLAWQVLASDGHITRGEVPFSAK